jgi:hypothetical protein
MQDQEAQEFLQTMEAHIWQASQSIASISEPVRDADADQPSVTFKNAGQKRSIVWNGRQFEYGHYRSSNPRQLINQIIKDLMKNVISTHMTKALGHCPAWVEVFK